MQGSNRLYTEPTVTGIRRETDRRLAPGICPGSITTYHETDNAAVMQGSKILCQYCLDIEDLRFELTEDTCS